MSSISISHPHHFHLAPCFVELLPFQPTREKPVSWKRCPQDMGSAKRWLCFTKLGQLLPRLQRAEKSGRLSLFPVLSSNWRPYWGSWHCDAKIACCASVAEPVQRRVTRRFATKWLGLFSSQLPLSIPSHTTCVYPPSMPGLLAPNISGSKITDLRILTEVRVWQPKNHQVINRSQIGPIGCGCWAIG